ncbi:16S rRNA (cytosine(967)-C(5))-methyltransferase RsmB [Clostridium botulinum C]|uniref:16S rRNA (cytosine(967)-C(5))-methyltransferase n=2 Tax=Clostridium botulinum TaxID=1491 RepID=A0A9Q4TEZ0_CLOBO|nr:16S rRNA (cytosine(967)-C(5))-methyltransferase RsmB [Clostridium botulinum]EGO88506.1 16S rRNA methyltransferase [Clostridium botulinum C str. Stockholm]MCD3194398.1 16S rRNA (cytosine(967)-C(5))-methyltransferase RsmB [Clostridium botulinum C]MCD3199552.1 16S rRNA (cytosine(967)-C(5))-methyltransferase RsmB [Clostridium botulinum C]MCD3205027.1 16S rRNA (cytosine(967)-C(5))-methyltransferase RsmB [Clostridium botulinum C]MCD3207845.1 16S rRNA (cytosine(967)-C(5))-methyltransferase RsmB [C
MENARKICIDILEMVFNKNAYSNIVLRQSLNNQKINEKDKGLITEIVYGTIKYKYTIDAILNTYLKKGTKSVDSYILNILRITIYQIKYLDKIPNFAAVNEAVNIAKKHKSIRESKLVNGVLRNYLRNLDKVYYNKNSVVERLCFEYSCEKWLVKMFINQYNEEITEKILKGLNERPAVTVRVNNLKTDYDEAFNKLEEYGYSIEEGYVCPEAIIINKGKSIESNPLFEDGKVTVQDESAMLVAATMDIKEGSLVLDLCSAPGGKTTHISEIMNNTGKVMAFDIHENKLSLVKDNAKRLGINNIECSKLDASKFNEKLKETADAVLIDVPCSGLGIIRKKPEIKYTKNMESVKDIVNIQKEIMKNAARYVKVGGTLLYSTCTINKKENEQNIDWFIRNFPEYTVEPIFYGEMDNIIYNENRTVTILPNKYMDGFFIAKLKRNR